MKRRTFLTQSLLLTAAGAAAMTLTGCGFRLRGIERATLGIDTLTLTATAAALTDQVRRELENAGVTLTDEAPLRLTLGDEQVREAPLRGGDTINDEIELGLSVPFSVQRTRDNAYLLDQQRLEVVTTYLVNNDNPLVRDEQRENTLADLRRDAARQLLERLRALTS